MMRRPNRVADLLNPAGLLLPAANVIMQLSAPAVGYGVRESPVDSGNVYKHPFKRARTTGTYLAAATVGTDEDRESIRRAVDTVHAQVRSTARSPVSYNAFDPKLQLWVAACLYRYFVEQHELLYGPLDDDGADAVYHDAKRLGTTLRVIGGPLNLFATTGFLPAEFRTHMRLPWSEGQQRRFELLLTGLRLADRVIPRQLWPLGYQMYLRDMRSRNRKGRRVV